MSAKPTLGELLLGIEGLALLRLAFGDDAEARSARVREIRSLLARLDKEPELAAALEAPEYDLTEGYGLWSKTYDQPLRLFPIEHPTMRMLLDPLPASVVLDAACGTGRYSQYLAERGHRVIGVDCSQAMLARRARNCLRASFARAISRRCRWSPARSMPPSARLRWCTCPRSARRWPSWRGWSVPADA